MTPSLIPPKNAVLVAIDIAKRRNEVLIAFPDHRRRKRLSVLNTREEHDRFTFTDQPSAHSSAVIRR